VISPERVFTFSSARWLRHPPNPEAETRLSSHCLFQYLCLFLSLSLSLSLSAADLARGTRKGDAANFTRLTAAAARTLQLPFAGSARFEAADPSGVGIPRSRDCRRKLALFPIIADNCESSGLLPTRASREAYIERADLGAELRRRTSATLILHREDENRKLFHRRSGLPRSRGERKKRQGHACRAPARYL